MTALYYPDFDCTPASRAIEHASTVHDHHATERAAIQAYRAWLAISCEQTARGERYCCIRGPGGIVRGIVDDGRRLYAVNNGMEIWVPRRATHLLTLHGPVPRPVVECARVAR